MVLWGTSPLHLVGSCVNFEKSRDDQIRDFRMASHNGGGVHFSKCQTGCAGNCKLPKEEISRKTNSSRC